MCTALEPRGREETTHSSLQAHPLKRLWLKKSPLESIPALTDGSLKLELFQKQPTYLRAISTSNGNVHLSIPFCTICYQKYLESNTE